MPASRRNRWTASTTRLEVSFTQNQLSEGLSSGFADKGSGARKSGSSARLQPQPAFVSGSEHEANPTFQFPLFRGICESQILSLVITVCLVGLMGFAREGVVSSTLTATDLAWTPLAEAGIGSMLFIAVHEVIARSSFRPACHLQFATSDFVHTLFGRRSPLHASSQKDGATVQFLKTCATTMLASGLLSLLTATCQELIFRGFLMDILLQHVVHTNAAAVLIQSLLYAFVMTDSNDFLTEDALLVGSTKVTQGLLLGGVAVAHGLIPCILVQWLVNWHIWTKTWHQVNGQMDWAELQEMPVQQRSSHLPQLPPPMYQSLYRLYCAFDSSHQHSLSLSDIQRAVSYAFMQDKDAPSPEQVEALAMRYASKPTTEDKSTGVLDFDDFLAVLFTLRSQSMKATAS